MSEKPLSSSPSSPTSSPVSMLPGFGADGTFLSDFCGCLPDPALSAVPTTSWPLPPCGSLKFKARQLTLRNLGWREWHWREGRLWVLGRDQPTHTHLFPLFSLEALVPLRLHPRQGIWAPLEVCLEDSRRSFHYGHPSSRAHCPPGPTPTSCMTWASSTCTSRHLPLPRVGWPTPRTGKEMRRQGSPGFSFLTKGLEMEIQGMLVSRFLTILRTVVIYFVIHLFKHSVCPAPPATNESSR